MARFGGFEGGSESRDGMLVVDPWLPDSIEVEGRVVERSLVVLHENRACHAGAGLERSLITDFLME